MCMRPSALILLSRGPAPLLALCLLIAPLCATRCTLSSCFDVNSHQNSALGCHHPSTQSHGSCTLAATPGPSCLPTVRFLTALPPQRHRVSPGLSIHAIPRFP